MTTGLAQRLLFVRRKLSSICLILESSPRTYPVNFIRTPTLPLLVILLFVVDGCALAPIGSTTDLYSVPESADCLALFTTSDKVIERAGTRDSQATRVPGFPFLRTSRFLSSLRGDLSSDEAREHWIERLSALDVEGRRIETRNLAPLMPYVAETEAIERCRTVLVRHALSETAVFEVIRRRAVVPDSYRLWARTLGLYPLTSLFVLAGVERLQDREGRHFATDSDRLYQSTEPIAYGSATDEVGENPYDIVTRAPRDALGIPLIDADDLARLFEHYSPIWSVAHRSRDDRIGTVRHNGEGISIDTGVASVYTRASYTKFAGEILLQLSYTVWFPARPKRGALDILGGAIDGITWRVTLDTSGRLLAADAMHNCGCYYMVFPAPGIRVRERGQRHEEPLWVPRSLPINGTGRTVIHVSSDAHYIRQVEVVDTPATQIALRPLAYDDLRSLATPRGGHQNLFAPSGLIEGSERGERWVLWPMGIESAGAMRQVGHHAIAFIGRRHFDDPDLLETNFERTAP